MRRAGGLVSTIRRQALGKLFFAYLAEDYDGIGQYAMVSPSKASTTAAIKAKVAAGDFGRGIAFPAGTRVVVFSDHGGVEILTLGGPISVSDLWINATFDVDGPDWGTPSPPDETWVEVDDAETFVSGGKGRIKIFRDMGGNQFLDLVSADTYYLDETRGFEMTADIHWEVSAGAGSVGLGAGNWGWFLDITWENALWSLSIARNDSNVLSFKNYYWLIGDVNPGPTEAPSDVLGYNETWKLKVRGSRGDDTIRFKWWRDTDSEPAGWTAEGPWSGPGPANADFFGLAARLQTFPGGLSPSDYLLLSLSEIIIGPSDE